MVNCDNPKNDQERSLCACKRTTDALTDALNDYKEQYKTYEKLHASWRNWKDKYERWKVNSGEFDFLQKEKETLEGEKYLWNNCVSEAAAFTWAGESKKHEWCQNDMEGAGRGRDWYHFSGDRDNCFLSAKGVCKRTQEGIDKALKVTKEAVKPTKADDGKTWFGVAEPTPPEFNFEGNIQCCSQIFDINTTGETNFEKISQNCSQKISEALSLEQETFPLKGNAFAKNTLTDNKKIIIAVLILVFCLFSVSSILVALLNV